jgi:hypothetical protein
VASWFLVCKLFKRIVPPAVIRYHSRLLQNNRHFQQSLSKRVVHVSCFTSFLKLEAARAMHPSGCPRQRG